MSSPTKLEPCVEHTLDKKETRVKRLKRAQWLRAAILGANDGLLSTTLLMIGVGAALEKQWPMILSGLAGALAGAFSMAVGEFVSVSTQRDIEIASFPKHGSKVKLEISSSPNHTVLDMKHPKPDIMSPVSLQETGDSLAHTNKVTESTTLEKNWAPVSCTGSPMQSPIIKVTISDARKSMTAQSHQSDDREALPNPYKAAFASAAAFLCGSLVPLVAAALVSNEVGRIVAIVVVTSIALGLFGGIGAYIGGLPLRASAIRVLVGGWISMVITYCLLKPFDKDFLKGHGDD